MLSGSRPLITLKYFKNPLILFVKLESFDMNAPNTRKGIPRPMEYASSRRKLMPGEVAARTYIAPSIAPTHGVHPSAKAKPKTNEER